MEESRQAGWYKDPHDEDEMRFWDGQCWTDMTRSSAPETSTAVKMPGEGVRNFYKIIHGLTTAFIKVVITLGVIFILSIIPVTFTSLGQYQIGGMPVISIASILSQYAVLGAIIAAGIAIPMQALATIIPTRVFAAILCEEADKSYASGEYSIEDHDYLYKSAQYVLRVKKAQIRCTVVGFILSAIIALLIHDPLMTAIGNPWTDLLSLIILGVAIMLIGFVLDSAITQKLKTEDPADLYSMAIKIE